jgi:propanol-preferring alcohol dehydrogenase
MRAWVVHRPGPMSSRPLQLRERAVPEPGSAEVRVRVRTCGVCRTDLHVAEGDLPGHHEEVVPGHEVVGVVDALGPDCTRFSPGDRIGIAWLRHTCGRCRFCRRGAENLCLTPRFTGWDDDGGYAEYALVPEDFAYPIPDAFDDEHAAPLLCAGIIGYRALRCANVPEGGRLGVFGFGGSAHLAAQLAIAEGAQVVVYTRSAAAQRLAVELGAVHAAAPSEVVPGSLDAALLFAPAGELVPIALSGLDRGGTLAVAGIHLSEVPPLNYAEHLFSERVLRSVTANTRRDGEDFLAAAARIGIAVHTQPYPFGRADVALADLASGRVRGAAVLCLP